MGNPSMTHAQQRNSTFIAVLQLKVIVSPSTQSKNLTAMQVQDRP